MLRPIVAAGPLGPTPRGRGTAHFSPLRLERMLDHDPDPPELGGFPGMLLQRVPAFDELRRYSWFKFRRDLLAGLTVAAVAVPQAMAYASIFNMPVQYGLYTAIVMTAVGALFDASRHLINGPTNAISIAMLSALAIVPPEKYVDAAIMMALLIGAIQISITLLRLGDLSRFISSAVIVGFTAGASVLLLLDQLKNVLGFTYKSDPHDHFLKRFGESMWYGGPVHWPTASLAALTILVVLVCRGVNRRFKLLLPELLLGMISASVAVWLLGWNAADTKVALVGDVPTSLPSFGFPRLDWSLTSQLAGSALAIAMLGLLEAIAMAKSLAAKSGQKLDVDQQCLSEGMANFVGSFFQCFPGSGSLTRSYINYTSGAVTQWSGVISAAAVAATVLALGPLAAYVPKAALAGVLILTAFRMIDFAAMQFHWRATNFDRAILLATALSAVLISIEFCILIGVLLSFVLYVPRAAQIWMTELTITSDHKIRELQPADPRCRLFRIFNFEGELFFGCGPQFERQLEQISAAVGPELRVVMLRAKRLRNPDAYCLDLLERFVLRMRDRGVAVLISGVRPDLDAAMRRVGLIEIIGEEYVFREQQEIYASTMAALQKAYSVLGESRCDHCPNRLTAAPMGPDGWTYDI